ncbi:MAG TPA: efflux RND transporter permease subunit [Gammaproteobacteria bacterium]|nr:efflux RND transporter permease subunit [Gammaproteobacteria bacterium]
MNEESEKKGSANNQQEIEKLDTEHLGLAGKTARAFINSPVTPLLMMAALALGLLGLFFTPRQEDPKISVPMVDIFIQYPGASPEQVASLVTDPLERIMSEIPGVRHVYSASRRGDAIVTVRFKVGENLENSIVKVHDKLQSNLDRMPPGVKPPLVKPIGIDDVPVVTVTLWSDELDDGLLRTLALDVLQRIKEVPDTGKGFVTGGRTEQIRVEVSAERLSGFGVSIEEVANTIRTANSEKPAGSVEGGNTSFRVYTGSFLRSAEEVSRLVVAIKKGMPVYVRDVANVFEAPSETEKMVTFYSGVARNKNSARANGSPAVTISIAKKIGSNGVTISKAIIKKLDSLKGRLIPSNVHVEITRDYGKSADDKVNELLMALFEAAVAVSILCLIGLGLRAASVVITIIPIVILITVWSAWVLDYTIDRVSLFALVFSIGILVDDATVVVENIFRRWLRAGRTTVDIAIDAVREVGNPTILATLAIIAAMLPMGVVSGLMGPYMRPIPVLGASAMFFSLLAAFIFAPWLAMRVRPKLKALERAEQREHKINELIGRFYHPCMKPLCNGGRLSYVFLYTLIALTFLACAMFYTNAVTVKMLPFDNKPEFNVVINMPEGTALPVTANVTAQFADALKNIPEVTALQTYTGTASPFNFNGMVRHYYLRQQPWEADIQVMLLDKKARQRPSHEIAVAARHILNNYITGHDDIKASGVRIQVVEMPPGPPVLQTVVAEIYGPTAEIRRKVAEDMTKMFSQAPGVVDVDNYMIEPHNYWRFEVDTEKAVRRGISVDMINRNLEMALGGYKLGDIKRTVVLEPTYIVIQVPMAARAQIKRLETLPIKSRISGEIIPLAELGRFVQAQSEHIIYHKDLRNVEYVTGEMEGRLGAPIYGMFDVEDLLKNYKTPDGVTITGMPNGLLGPPDTDNISGLEWTGEWTVTYETFRDMGMAFMAALLLIYGLIVWEFKNFKLGGLIMAPIPLTLIGIIPGHWVMNAEFTATSMIGFIALAGIIVRNSILLVEFVIHELKNGVDIRVAVMNAGQIRMRPIFITALTLMAGAIAIITDPIFQGMAVSLLFGTAVATILTLVVIPLGCISARKQFYILIGQDMPEEPVKPATSAGLPLWMLAWSKTITLLTWIFYALRAIYFLVRMLLGRILAIFKKSPDDHTPGSGSPPNVPPVTPAPVTPSGGREAEPGSADAGDPTTEKDVSVSAREQAEPAAEQEAETGQGADSGLPETAVAAVTEKEAAEKPAVKKASTMKVPARKTVAKKVTTKKAVVKKKSVAKKKTASKVTVEKTGKPVTSTGKKTGRTRRGIRLKTDMDE